MWLVKACDERDPYGAYLKRIDKFRLNLTSLSQRPRLATSRNHEFQGSRHHEFQGTIC